MIQRIKFFAMTALACCAPGVVNNTQAVELMIDVDAYDNFSEPEFFDTELYGPEHITKFFENCRSNGVSSVYWRVQCQIASFRSKLNYNLSEELMIRSYPENRKHGGAFAAKVGVQSAKDGIFQTVDTKEGEKYNASAWIAADTGQGAFFYIENAESGETLGKSELISGSTGFQKEELSFEAPGPVRIGFSGQSSDDINIFFVDDVSLKDFDGKELVVNGDMERFSKVQPSDWQITDRVNFLVLCGDILDIGEERLQNEFGGPGSWGPKRNGWWQEARLARKPVLDSYDPLGVAVREAHRNDVKIYAWIDPLDDGRKVPPSCTGWWVSRFHEDHPEYRLVDKDGNRRWGQLCFGYPEVRRYKNAMVQELLDYGVDGIYLKTAEMHNRIWDGYSYRYDNFAHNDIALAEYDKHWGKPADGNYELKKLRSIQGEYFYQWIAEASELLRENGKGFVYSMRPGDIYDRPLGAWPNFWEKIVDERLIDLFLLELRPATAGNKNLLREADERFRFIDRCRDAGVRVGYDFYLNALAENRMTPQSLGARPHEFFVNELKALAQEPLDLIGIYETMYVDRDNYWPDIRKVHEFIATLKDRKDRYEYDPNQKKMVICENTGNNDPESYGWICSEGSAGITIWGHGTAPAWVLSDASSDEGTFANYSYTPTPEEKGNMAARGWKLTVDIATPLPNCAPEGGSVFIAVPMENKSFLLRFGTAGKHQIVELFDNKGTVFGSYELSEQEGYHLHELVYDPITGTADLYVDGKKALSGFDGGSVGSDSVVWGSGLSEGIGEGRWRKVKLELRPVPKKPEASGSKAGGEDDL